MKKSKVELLSLPEELLLHILSFLPWQDILRCTSLCKALRQAYMSSSELQYITELGGQQLLPVFGGHISFSQHLQLLRDKLHAWSKLDIHSFEAISIPEQFCTRTEVTIVSGHACFWKPSMHSCKIFPILPKSLQQKQSDFDVLNVFIDPVQNLLAIVYVTVIGNGNMVYDEDYYIDLVALDGDGAHPQAAGRTLFLSDLPTHEDFITKSTKIEGFGETYRFTTCLTISRALLHLRPDGGCRFGTGNTQQRPIASSAGPIIDPDFDEIDICFLGNDRFLIVSDHLKLYSIEDMSQAPRLLACFSWPVPFMNLRCFTPTDDIARSSHPQIQAPQVTWISNPEHRLLSLVTRYPDLHFVISTRIFFEPDFVDSEGPATIPWESWGPENTRAFPHQFSCKLAVSGSRALYAFAAAGVQIDDSTEYRLHLMDFSPLAVKRHHQQGLGRMVNEPSTVEHIEKKECITTSMPYVEVVSDRTFSNDDIIEMWLDRDKLYLLKDRFDIDKMDRFEVIEF